MFRSFLCAILVIILAGTAGKAQRSVSPADLKKLSIEDLINVKVTLVSRTPENLSRAPSAIQVLTGDQIRRTTATNIPDALRLFPNVQVAQLNSSAWIIGVRGFNTIFSNKLLVMIDGRTVYTPLFGGVIWDLQNVLLEDVERIEVVSGPGATLWGANAVNGVINIVTKKSSATQGAYVSASAGNVLTDQVEARYGGRIGNKGSYRVYGMHLDREATIAPNGTKSGDAWLMTQGGFRFDFNPSDRDQLTVQSDIYSGKRKTASENSPMNGQNVLGRWSRKISNESDLTLQVYYDRYFREDVPASGSDRMSTVDVDFQHRFAAGKRQQIVWGSGYRVVRDFAHFRTQNVAILPPKKSLDMFNGFIQDEIAITDKTKLTLGSKIMHNVYTGVELQPAVRLSFLPKENQILWGAVSRAVRTPSRFDRDYFLPAFEVPPPDPSVAGGPNFESEKLIAYELGYRIQPGTTSALSLSTFYNVYNDLYSVEPLPNTQTYQIMNGSEGNTWGYEISGTYQAAKDWTLGGGYSYIDNNLHPKSGHVFTPDYLVNDSKHRAVLRSTLNLPLNLQLDVTGMYKSKLGRTLATASVPGYTTFDVRLAWVTRRVEIMLAGQNLAQEEHAEFDVLQMRRSFYAKIVGRF